MEVVDSCNCVYRMAYFVVWYCTPVLTSGVAKGLRESLNTNLPGTQRTHTCAGNPAGSRPLVILAHPSTAIADSVKILKGTTARLLFACFRESRQHLEWCSVVSVVLHRNSRNVSAGTIRHYIERTEHIRGRH
jgi:putative transposase